MFRRVYPSAIGTATGQRTACSTEDTELVTTACATDSPQKELQGFCQSLDLSELELSIVVLESMCWIQEKALRPMEIGEETSKSVSAVWEERVGTPIIKREDLSL